MTRFHGKRRVLALAVDVFLIICFWPLLFRSRAKPGPLAGVKNILVVEPWGIGDVVLATAILDPLQQLFPGSCTTFLLSPRTSALLAGDPRVRALIVAELPWVKFVPRRSVVSELRALWQVVRRLRLLDFDLSLDARMDARNTLLVFLGGVRNRSGFREGGGGLLLTHTALRRKGEEHRAEDWRAVLRAVGGREEAALPRIHVADSLRSAASEFLKASGFDPSSPVIALHPGARKTARQWPPDRFEAVAASLRTAGYPQILMVSGDAASDPTTRATTRFHGGLDELAAILSVCDVLICNDGGPMHIADSLGVGVCAVFGPTRPEWFAPSSQRHAVIIRAGFPCRPCFDSCHFDRPWCIESVQVEEVVDRALKKLRGVNEAPTRWWSYEHV